MFFTRICLFFLLLFLLESFAQSHSDSIANTDRGKRGGIGSLMTRSAKSQSRFPPIQPYHLREVKDVSGNVIPPYNTTYYFNQLIDHNNPSLGTFQQRYWHTWEYYKPGGPIMLQTPGETNAEEFFTIITNATLQGLMAQKFNGATISIEHRFFGLSNPYPNLTTSSLNLLTIDQAINDLVYFAQNVKLPMPGGDTDAIRPNKVPWVLFGASYPGALTAWTMNKKPGVFWAGYSSSGVVQPIADFWQYFDPIRENMPQNCSLDVQRVITYVDEVYSANNVTLVTQLESTLGVEGITNPFALLNTLSEPIFTWQHLLPSNASQFFYFFCDSLEVMNGEIASPNGRGLDIALAAWGIFNKRDYVPAACRGFTDINSCLSIDDRPEMRDIAIDNEDRSWFWMICNEMGWSQSGAPGAQPAIVSRHLTLEYFDSQCQRFFDGAFRDSSVQSRVQDTSKTYLGWNISVDRVFFANGKRDPWLEATLSAPSQNIPSTSLRPIALSDGNHAWDMSSENALLDKSIAEVHNEAFSSMRVWLADFQPGNSTSNPLPTPSNNTSTHPRGSSFIIVALVLQSLTWLL